jgi:Holliday junction resolvase
MNACQKGKRGEREFAAVLRDSFGLDARRGVQYQGSIDSPDVVGGWQGTHPEVKRVENLDINDAVQQAVRDAGVQIPYVAHRKNNCPWLITLRVDDLAAFMQRMKETTK